MINERYLLVWHNHLSCIHVYKENKNSNVKTNLFWTFLVSGLLSFEHPSVLLFLYQYLDIGRDLHRITSGFHRSFATGVESQQGTLTLPNTWLRTPFSGLAYALIVKTSFSKLAVTFLDFSPWMPLGTFLFLLKIHADG